MRGPTLGLLLVGVVLLGAGTLVLFTPLVSSLVVPPAGIVLLGFGAVFVLLAGALPLFGGPLPIETPIETPHP